MRMHIRLTIRHLHWRQRDRETEREARKSHSLMLSNSLITIYHSVCTAKVFATNTADAMVNSEARTMLKNVHTGNQ